MNKKLFAFLAFGFLLNAQVGIGTTTPDPNSSLDISASSKPILLPRVADVNTIVSTPGMLIYDTTSECIRGKGQTSWGGCIDAPPGVTLTYPRPPLLGNLGESNCSAGNPTLRSAGVVVDIPTSGVVFDSSNNAVALVNATTGVITPSSTGTVAITATFPDGQSVSRTLQVYDRVYEFLTTSTTYNQFIFPVSGYDGYQIQMYGGGGGGNENGGTGKVGGGGGAFLKVDVINGLKLGENKLIYMVGAGGVAAAGGGQNSGYPSKIKPLDASEIIAGGGSGQNGGKNTTGGYSLDTDSDGSNGGSGNGGAADGGKSGTGGWQDGLGGNGGAGNLSGCSYNATNGTTYGGGGGGDCTQGIGRPGAQGAIRATIICM